MKAKVIGQAGYTFDKEVIGKIFDIVEDFGHGVCLDIRNTSNDGLWNFSKGNVELLEDEPKKEDTKLEVGGKVFLNPTSKWVGSGAKDSANPLGVVGVITSYSNSDLLRGSLGIDVKWGNGLANSYREVDLIPVAKKEGQIKASPHTKLKQKPKQQTQTKVYIAYRDGSNHLTKRVLSVVVRAEDKVITITSERNIGGLIIRENVTIPSTSVDWIDITSKEANYSYFFDEHGQVKASCQWFDKNHKFKTHSH